MNIDDIYFAAVNGEKDKLIALLDAGEVDINQPIDCGVNNGVRTTSTLLYSVLNTMFQNTGDFNYEIIDILIKYDININGFVELSNDSFTRKIPIVCFAIRDWKSHQLVYHLLQRGLNPNIRQTECYSDGHNESYPLAYIAIVFSEDYRLLEMILGHGADPNGISLVYNHEYAASQAMPLLFHALITCKSYEKCVALFRFGANINEETIVGFGRVPKIAFKKYISSTYRASFSTLEMAYKQGRNYPLKPIHISREKFVTNPQKVTAKSEPLKEDKREKAHMYLANDGLMELRSHAIDLIDYDRKVRNDYVRAYRDSNIQIKTNEDRNRKKAADEYIAAVNNTRSLRVRQLNEIDAKLTGGKQRRWWNVFNGLNGSFGTNSGILLWTPFDRLSEGPEGVRLTASCTSTGTITAEQIKLLIKSGEVSPLYMQELEPNANYSLGELCLWEINDATEVTRRITKTYSEDEISAAIKSRNQGIDSMESFLNLITERGNFSNEELYSLGAMGTNEYFNSKFYRDNHLSNYENKLRNSTTTHVEVKNQRLYYQEYAPIGIIAFDNENNAVAVLNYNVPILSESYTTDYSNNVVDVKQSEPYYSNVADLRKFALRNLCYLPIDPPDVISNKPDYLSEEEWIDFIYHGYIVYSRKLLPAQIQDEFIKKGFEKQVTIRRNTL